MFNSKSVVLCVVLLSLFRCNQESNQFPVEQPLLSLVDSVAITESSYLYQAGIIGMDMDSIGNFYISDAFHRRIIRTNPPFEEYAILGGPGLGHGEYMMPWDLEYEDGYLFYSNMGSSLIKSMNVLDNNTTKTRDIAISASASNVEVQDSVLVLYNGSMRPQLRVYSIKDREPQLLAEGMTQDEAFQRISDKFTSGGGLDISTEGLIYAVHNYPFKIFVFDTQCELQKTFEIEDPPYYTPLTDNLLKQIHSDDMMVWTKALLEFSHLTGLWLIERSDSTQDIIVKSWLREADTNVYHFFDNTGEWIHSVEFNFMELLTVQGNLLYFYDTRTDTDGTPIESMKIYEYNR